MGMSIEQMGANEWLIVAGAIVGPILAVQAQKLVEALGDGRKRRERIFNVLMGTRQSRISPEHVGALNSIDLAFYDTGFWLFRWQPRSFKTVRKSWSDYRTHLTPPQNERPTEGEAHARFQGRAEELFVNLLEKIAIAVGYKFDRHELQTGSYSPEAHGHLELQQAAIRNGLIEVLSGDRPLPMDVKTFPSNPAMAERIIAAQESLAAALERYAGVMAGGQGAQNRDGPGEHN